MDTIHLGKNSNNIAKNKNNVSFTGYRNEYNAKGSNVIKFYAPPYDRNNYDISLEIFDYPEEIMQDGEGGYKFNSTQDLLIVPPGVNEKFAKNEVYEYKLDDADKIAYRFVITNKKNPADKKVLLDAGTRAIMENGETKEQFNLLFSNTGTSNKSGPMYHIFADSYGVINKDGTNADKADNFARNHFNKAGGNIQNIINELNKKNGELAPYNMIISTPLFGGDEVSSHGYWTANPYQISTLKGGVNDFKELITAMFDNGKDYVADGAFTSQAFEGAQMTNVLKWGKDSEFAKWFKLDNQQGARLKLGVLPDKIVMDLNEPVDSPINKEAQVLRENLGVRIVNPKGVKGYKYDPSKPTYMQFFDKRLSSDEQISDLSNLIKIPDIATPEDRYDITTYEDSAQHYFMIDPESDKLSNLPKDVLDKYKQTGTLTLDDIDKGVGIKEFFSMPQYDITTYGASGGATCWDGQADLIKLNLSSPDVGTEVGNTQVQNYVQNVAKYWTRLSANSLIEHISKEFASNDPDKVIENIANQHNTFVDIFDKNGKKTGEKNILEDVKNNVLNGSYINKIESDKRDSDTILKNEIADFPFESIEFAPDLVATLSTSYISPRPKDTDELKKSRLDLLEDNATNNQKTLYKNLYDAASRVLKEIDGNLPDDAKIFESGNVSNLTPYGKYVSRILMPDIVKFAVVEGLFDDISFKSDKNGQVLYYSKDAEGKEDYYALRSKGLSSLGIKGTSEQDEAQKLFKSLNGIKNIDDKKVQDFSNLLSKRFENVKLEDLKLAEAVMEQTGAGLNWRFDAAKDVADLDKLRANDPGTTFESAWQSAIDFWKGFVDNVKAENNSAYTIAEVTNLHDFFDWNDPKGDAMKYKFGKFVNPNVAERMFYEQTGATTGSNFSVFFGLFPEFFGQNFEHGNTDWTFADLKTMFYHGGNGMKGDFLESGSSLPFLNQNHIFVGNHDKPRPIHAMALDMELFLVDHMKRQNFDSSGAQFGNVGSAEKAKEAQEKFNKVIEKNKDIIARATGGRDDYDQISYMAVAVGDKYLDHFEKAMVDEGCSDAEIATVKQAIVDLVNGNFKRNRRTLKEFLQGKPKQKQNDLERARAFGYSPFEVTVKDVMKQAKWIAAHQDEYQKNIPDSEKVTYKFPDKKTAKAVENKAFLNMIKTPMQKMSSMWEMMCSMVGIPTLYSGDELAQSGYEWPTKNGQLGNRAPLHMEWLTDDGKKDIQAFNRKMMQVSALHKQKGLSAMADGDPVMLKQDIISSSKLEELKSIATGKNAGKLDEMISGTKESAMQGLFALYKQNYKGSGVLTVLSDAQFEGKTKGTKATKEEVTGALVEPEKAIKDVEYIKLQDEKNNDILPEGTLFKRKIYNGKEYVDDGKIYQVKKQINDEGKLEARLIYENPKTGKQEDIRLIGTTNIFYKTYDPKNTKVYNM